METTQAVLVQHSASPAWQEEVLAVASVMTWNAMLHVHCSSGVTTPAAATFLHVALSTHSVATSIVVHGPPGCTSARFSWLITIMILIIIMELIYYYYYY